MSQEIENYIRVVPNACQKMYQEMGFNVFFHYGMNTFTDREWGDGKTPPSCFNPTCQDTDQWVRTIQKLGAKGAILTCKHHDGFCLWPTKTTEYSVKNSPYKQGKGDVVRELSDSCRKYGIRFGIYLSPWDRNSPVYATPQYNDFYIEQLTELLTDYGEIFCVWLDGACGAQMDGKPKQVYDFERIYETVHKLQPNACIASCGPDVRWVGNEGGHTRRDEWNVVPASLAAATRIEADSQQTEDGTAMQLVAHDTEDLGSRAVLRRADRLIWYPAEVDFSIHKGWFYHRRDERRTLKNLLDVYYRSVGGNCTLLLNIPPDTEGRIAEKDLQRLQAFGEAIHRAFAKPAVIRQIEADPCEPGYEPEHLLDDTDSCYAPMAEDGKTCIRLTLDHRYTVDKLVLKEQCDFSQRVEHYEIYAKVQNEMVQVYSGNVIGFRRFAMFEPVQTDTLLLKITQCRSNPHLRRIGVYAENGGVPTYTKAERLVLKIKRSIEEYKLKQWRKQQEKLAKKIKERG